MGLPFKTATASNICLKDKNEIVFNATKNFSIFKNYSSSLENNMVYYFLYTWATQYMVVFLIFEGMLVLRGLIIFL